MIRDSFQRQTLIEIASTHASTGSNSRLRAEISRSISKYDHENLADRLDRSCLFSALDGDQDRKQVIRVGRNSQTPAKQAANVRSTDRRYGAAGDRFCAKAYDVDPCNPIGNIKEAWEAAKLQAGRILRENSKDKESDKPIQPLVCRFHDLRHTAGSRMLNAGVPIAKVAKIAGWSTATMVRMAARYGHFTLNDLRGAVESISNNGIDARSLVFSPVSTENAGVIRTN